MPARLAALAVVISCLSALGCVQPPAADDPTHPLVGKKAPLFTADLHAGGTFDLAEHLGRDVLILDFWATWCGPCRQALPTLSEVAGEYRDRGVKFFAVDLSESSEEVQGFLKQSSLPLTVVMDRDGAVANAYGVDAIPQTVIIDRQGTVRFVHVGVSGDLREQLGRELNELVGESNPAENANPMASVVAPSAMNR